MLLSEVLVGGGVVVSIVIRPFINGFINPEHIFSEMLTHIPTLTCWSRVIIFYAVMLYIVPFFWDITVLLLCRSNLLQQYCIGGVHQYNLDFVCLPPVQKSL